MLEYIMMCLKRPAYPPLRQSSGFVTRTASYCEMDSELDLSTCEDVISCFDGNEGIEGWIGCMENGVRLLVNPRKS